MPLAPTTSFLINRLEKLASLTSRNTTAISSAPIAEMHNTAMIFAIMFVLFFIYRYLRTIISIVAWNTYQPKPVQEHPRYTCKDVSVIIPTTFKTPEELIKCVRRIRACTPSAVYIVTANANVKLVESTLALDSSNVQVLGVDKLNKRTQILRAMPLVDTAITVLADDDVFWPDDYLPYVLAIFEDSEVGAGGTRQRVQRTSGFVNFLGISYLERRVWNNCATNAIDGSISTLSGRTAAYRSYILKSDEFQYYFTHDMWRGKPLNSDDDKCLTRYVYSHGWKICLQFDPRSTLETTVEPDLKGYLSQCLRWARAHWRGNYTVMENETYWRSWQYAFGLYYIYVGQFQTPSLLVDAFQFFLLAMALTDSSVFTARLAYGLLAAWIFFTKIMKLIPHFRRHPADIKYIPVSILFSYFHGFLNVYALASMQVTHWSSQNLSTLAEKRVDSDETVPLLKDTMLKADGFQEPTPGNYLVGNDYFQALLSDHPPFADSVENINEAIATIPPLTPTMPTPTITITPATPLVTVRE